MIMNDFVTKKVEAQGLGGYLAAARSRAHMSVEEAAKFAGVQAKFVAALEEGRVWDLPADVYVRGFLRSLCRLYRVLPADALRQYAAESELESELGAAAPAVQKRALLPRFVLTPRVLTILGLSLFGILSLAYLYFQVHSLRRAPALTLSSPQSDFETKSSHLLVAGKAEAGAEVAINGEPVATDAAGAFQENLSLAPGANRITVQAKNKFGQETVVARSVLLSGEKQIAGAESGVMLEVRVEVEGARVTVEADGREVFSGTMLPGASQVFAARERIVLGSSNAGATRISVNGRDLGILGKPGEELRNIEFGP